MSNNMQCTTAVVAAAGIIGAGYCAYRAYSDSRRTKLPEHWTRVGTLKNLKVYPVKSCRPVEIDKVECTLLGVKSGWLRDRLLMVVDETDHFCQARVYPELYRIQPTVVGSILTLAVPELDSVQVDLADVVATKGKSKKSAVWGVEVPILDCGDEVSVWLTKVINRPAKTFRLGYYASQVGRGPPNDATGRFYKMTNKDSGAFSDDTSYNLVNEASVIDLNTRLGDKPVTVAHFRPVFVLTGAKPYDEDNWKFVKIGENIFEVVLPCVRCAITTIDPETGIRHPNNEPLTTLRTYRLVEGEKLRKIHGIYPRMGIQLALRSGPGGTVSINDDIYVA